MANQLHKPGEDNQRPGAYVEVGPRGGAVRDPRVVHIGRATGSRLRRSMAIDGSTGSLARVPLRRGPSLSHALYSVLKGPAQGTCWEARSPGIESSFPAGTLRIDVALMCLPSVDACQAAV